MHRLTLAEKAGLAQRYLTGETSGQLAKSMGVTDVAILNHLKKMGVHRRDPSAARRQYPLWDEAFSALTPEAAYWVGFLMADGCVLDESKIQIGLAAKDLGHLEKLRCFLRTETRPIHFVPSTKSCQLKVHSRQLVRDLAKYGVLPRKSLTAKAEEGIHLNPSFWLGVLDGDGCLDLRRNGRVRIVGSKLLMNQLAVFIEHFQIRGRNRTFSVKVRHRNRLSTVTLEGQRARNFLTLVYSTSSPSALDRKRVIAEKLLSFGVCS